MSDLASFNQSGIWAGDWKIVHDPVHSHHREPDVSSRENNFSIVPAIGRLRGILRVIHEAIIVAKMRRLRSERMFHAGVHENEPVQADADAAKFPRRPLILGDKWDF